MDIVEKVKSWLPILLSLLAIVLSFTTYYSVNVVHIGTLLKITGFTTNTVTIPQNQNSSVNNIKDVNGEFFITVFNYGNRIISINNIHLYVQEMDFDALKGMSYTPPCKPKNISQPELLDEVTSNTMLTKLKTIDAQHIEGLYLKFPIFQKYPNVNHLSGIICLNVASYAYDSSLSNKTFPISIISFNTGDKALLPIYQQPNGQLPMHRIF